MIRNLIIKGFKRFRSADLEMRPLTVLAGRNGAGKTSVIHSLLLARHAALRCDGIAELNGPFGMELGWFEDVINVDNENGFFSIALEDNDDGTAEWTFMAGDTELYARVRLPEHQPKLFSRAKARGFQYLSPERGGPRITQKAAPLPQEMLEVGCAGEHVAHVLEKLGRSSVSSARHANIDDPEEFHSVKAQTELWLSRIVRPIELDTQTFPGTGVIALQFRNDGASPWVRPTNMGFGVSYTLPIVVATITAAEGGLIIVENPEAHLHPAGQSEMGAFLARMAATGLQIIIETHSDHVLNGIRRAIGSDHLLPADDAIVHFFADAPSDVQSLNFTASGGVSEWPSGFFDQYRLDVQRLTTARRPR